MSVNKYFLAAAALLCYAQVAAQQPFPSISVPPMIAADEARGSIYYVERYWERYDFAHAATLYTPETTEQGFADFARALAYVPLANARAAVRTMISHASVDAAVGEQFMELSERYFYDPNSPFRNDEFFIPALEFAIGSKATDATMRQRYAELLKTVSKNRPATTAADFVYTLADGSQGRMSELKSELLLLFFYNAGCQNCREVKDFLEASEVVRFYKEHGYLKVLAVYPDADLKEWRRWLPENPSWWISSYDKGERIRRGELYDLKAIPTIYLLDARKQVILKDPTPEHLEAVLRSL